MTTKLNRYLALVCLAWIVCVLAIKPLRAQDINQVGPGPNIANVKGNVLIQYGASVPCVLTIAGYLARCFDPSS